MVVVLSMLLSLVDLSFFARGAGAATASSVGSNGSNDALAQAQRVAPLDPSRPPAGYKIVSPTPAPKLTPIPNTNYEDQALDRKRDDLLAAVNSLPAATENTTGAQVKNNSGGKVRSQDGLLTIGIPSNVVSDTATLDVQVKKVAPKKGDPKSLRKGRPLLYNYELTAISGKTKKKVDKFSKDVVLVWSVTAKELAAAGVSGSRLVVVTYDEQRQDWVEVPSLWDPATNQLIAVANHFSSWGVDNAFDKVKNYLPSVNNFEVDLQSGTANVSYPLNLPAGPGGFGPKVSLSYNSGNIDRVAPDQQGASFVGYGWTLSTSYIAATQHHFGECDGTGYHPWTASIVMDGANGDLVRGTDGYWHTADETFTRVQYVQGSTRATDSWVAWSKEGIKYEFDQNALVSDNCAQPYGRTSYKWMLSRATDASGNVVNYTYKWQDGSTVITNTATLKDVEPTQVDATNPDKTRAVYPSQITYGAGGNKIRVMFDVVSRVNENNTDDITDADIESDIYQGFRINKIRVERKQETMPAPLPAGCNTTTGYCLLRQYDLTQTYDILLRALVPNCDPNDPDCDPTDPNNFSRYPHLTLTTITERGSDGVTQLPSSTFEYITENCCPGNYFQREDEGHLFWARNGRGGSVGFYYDAAGGDVSKWYRRVRAKRIRDGIDPNNPAPSGGSTAHDFKYFYDYRGATDNGPHISEEVTQVKPLHNEYTEFRGFAWVRVQDPMGQVTDHYFSQTDDFKGKEWRVQVGKVDVFADNMSTSPPGTNWTTSGSVVGTTDYLSSTNTVWQVPPGGAMTRPINIGYTSSPGTYQRGADGYDVSSRFMLRKVGSDTNNNLNFAGTWKLENTSGNGEYWGLRIARKWNPSIPAYEFDATATWATMQGSTLVTGTRSLSRWDTPGRPYRLDGLPVDTWYWVQLHTSPDGRYALELHQDDYLTHDRPGPRPTKFGDYISIRSSDVADGGGKIPLFAREQKWKFKQEVTGDGNYVAHIDDYAESRTIYSQTDAEYANFTKTRASESIQAETAKVNASYALVGLANNMGGLSIRFSPLTESWDTKFGEGTELWQDRTGKKEFNYDPRYGTQVSVNEHGNVRFYSVAEERSTRATTVTISNTTTYIAGKIGRTRNYNGIEGNANATLAAETLYYYDNQTSPGVIPAGGAGLVTKVEDVGVLNGAYNGQSTTGQSRYDARGNQTVTIDANNVPITTTFDLYYQSFPVQVARPNGRTEFTDFDFTKDVISSTVDLNGTRTTFRYDILGRPFTSWIAGFGSESSPNEKYTFSDLNQASVTPPFRITYEKRLGTTAGTNETTWQTRWFDGIGRTLEDVSLKNPATSEVVVVHNTYTVTAQLESTSMPYTTTGTMTQYAAPNLSKPKTTFNYDGANRTTMVVNPDNTAVIYNYMWPEASGVRDESGNLQKWKHVDGLLRTDWAVDYDYTSNPVAATEVHYTYDALDRMTAVQRDKWGRNSTVTIGYDGLGRKRAVNDPSQGTSEYDYDAAGNMTVQRDALYLSNATQYADHQIFYRYDAMNRVTGKYYGQAHYNSNLPDVKYRYDNDLGDAATKFSWGQLRHVEVTLQGQGASKANGHGFEYDARGLETAEVITTTYTSRQYRVGTTYDIGGRVASLTYPDPDATKEQVTLSYNAQGGGLPQSLATNKSTVWPVYNATYNERAQITLLDQGSNSPVNDHLITTYGYDDATTKRGLLSRTRVTSNGGSALHLDLNMAYSPSGNVTEIRQIAGSAGSSTNPTFTNTFTYDGLDRLKSAASTSSSIFPTEQYTYGSTGRLESRTIGGTNYNYAYNDNANGNGIYPDKPVAYRNYQYGYDANGNQTTRTNTATSSTQNRTFDPENRLVSIVEGNTTTEFVYDGNGSRLVKSVSTAPPAPAKTALLVVDNPAAINAADTAIKARLQSLGFTVTVKDDDLVAATDATGKTLVFVSATSMSTAINTKLRDVAVPVINSEIYLMDDLGMTDTPTTQMGAYTHTGVKIVDPSHPLAGGLTGDVTVNTLASTKVAWAIPNANAIKVATVVDDTTLATVFGYAPGAQMYGLTAPAKRVGLYTYNDTAAYHTASGWTLFDAAVRWATAPSGTTATGATRMLYVSNLYEENISNPADSTPPYTSYYYLNGKLVGMRHANQAEPTMDGQVRAVGDHLGSATLLVNSSAPPAVVERRYYKPYGEVAWQTGISQTEIGYSGERLDGETGLIYYGARFYDPVLSYFISPDSTVPDLYNPLDWNRYTFVRNNPLHYTDQGGRHPAVVLLVGLVIVAKVASVLIDYGWTAWDIVNSVGVLMDPDASDEARAEAGFNIFLALALEGLEPDEVLPVNLPIDDVVRHGIIAGAKQGAAQAAKKLGKKVASSVVNAAIKFDGKIDSYANLVSLRKKSGVNGNDVNIHHLLEKRFAAQFGISNTNDILSVGLAAEFHRQEVTSRLFTALNTDKSHTFQDIWNAYSDVYGHDLGQWGWLDLLWDKYFANKGIIREREKK
jgi:RHS repeat-associated protein